MIIERFLEFVIPYIAGCLDLVGVAIITYSAVVSLYKTISSKFDFTWDVAGVDFAKAMQLGLEFKLAAEIIKTVIVHSLNEFIVLASITAIRIIMSFVLHWELKHGTKSEGVSYKQKTEGAKTQ